MWKEINNCMADNVFLNNGDKSEEIWKTPRESWHTTCDGYIDTKDFNDAMNKVDGYSKILKTRKYDKIVTEEAGFPKTSNERSPISFNSQVVLSYNKVKFQRICTHKKLPDRLQNEKIFHPENCF